MVFQEVDGLAWVIPDHGVSGVAVENILGLASTTGQILMQRNQFPCIAPWTSISWTPHYETIYSGVVQASLHDRLIFVVVNQENGEIGWAVQLSFDMAAEERNRNKGRKLGEFRLVNDQRSPLMSIDQYLQNGDARANNPPNRVGCFP